jgi:UDP-N-acetylglucosamine 2-epimerase (non-hydrolysing)
LQVEWSILTARQAHSRPEGKDEGSLIMSGWSKDRLLQAVQMTRTQFKSTGPGASPTDDRGDQVPWKVAKVILRYTGCVNRRVWQRA